MGKSNADAMETLRNAMQSEGPKPGFIHIQIARRKVLPVPKQGHGRELKVSQSEPPPDIENVPPSPREQNKTDSEKAKLKHAEEKSKSSHHDNRLRNPVLDRLMTGMPQSNQQSNIRNESYIRATHDSINDTTDFAGKEQNNNGMTLHGNQAEMVLIEDDNDYQITMVLALLYISTK